VHALNPEAEPLAVVPLPDDREADVRYDYLLALEQEPTPDFRAESNRRRYRVADLLDGVRRDETAAVDGTSSASRSAAPTQPHTVILIHGIRTMALWQNEIRKTLEGEGFKVEPTNYGRFNLLRFLCPGTFFRWPIVKDITQQVRDIAARSPAPCSIIAHSFGTFLVAGILQTAPELTFCRIIFCGSVVRHRFRVSDYDHRFEGELINEVGTKDIWPVLAETSTTGYGSAGTYGFRRSGVRDRWHNGKTHSAFLTPDFCEIYWVPYLRDGAIIEDAPEAQPPPLGGYSCLWWFSPDIWS